MGYSAAQVLGNATKDVELKYTPTGTAIATISIAVNHKYTSGGETKEDVSYFDIKVFGKMAEACGQYLSKGSKVFVAGRLSQERWKNSDGQQRSKVVIIAERVEFLSAKNSETNQQTDDEESPF